MTPPRIERSLSSTLRTFSMERARQGKLFPIASSKCTQDLHRYSRKFSSGKLTLSRLWSSPTWLIPSDTSLVCFYRCHPLNLRRNLLYIRDAKTHNSHQLLSFIRFATRHRKSITISPIRLRVISSPAIE